MPYEDNAASSMENKNHGHEPAREWKFVKLELKNAIKQNTVDIRYDKEQLVCGAGDLLLLGR